VAICRHGGFDSPLGVASIDEACATRLLETSPLIFEHPAAHAREHSLEMQLPFIRRVLPHARIVPLLMGWQSRAVAAELGRTLGVALQGAAVVLVASTDLSHYHDAGTARVLDARVMAQVERFSPDGLQTLLDENPDHACGGGPTVAVMRAAQALGARDALILNYADSGDVSGDKSAVVGYLAAVLGSRHADSTGRT
jgi:MEMO1 family protein